MYAEKMRIGTLFSGIGAPEQGAKRVYGDNLEMAFACEYDKFARQSFEANYDIDPLHFHKDVNDMDGAQYRDAVDILIGGSPCQAFSIAGLRNGTDDIRGQLIYQYIRIVDEVKAPVIIYENVKGMMSIDGGKTIREFVQALRDIGYYCHYEVVNTKDHGVPQNRERIFLVGFLDHEAYHRFSFAPKQKLEKRLKDVLESEVDEKYYLSQKMLTFFDKHSTKRGQPLNVLTGNDSSSCLTARYAKCGLTDPYIKDKIGIRKLTPLECWRLQDFPDEAHNKAKEDGVSDSQLYKQAGNSMSVNVLEMIFRQIEKALSGENETPSLFDFAS
jgi:DNA (cytosine-5)-methyltransferase 1